MYVPTSKDHDESYIGATSPVPFLPWWLAFLWHLQDLSSNSGRIAARTHSHWEMAWFLMRQLSGPMDLEATGWVVPGAPMVALLGIMRFLGSCFYSIINGNEGHCVDKSGNSQHPISPLISIQYWSWDNAQLWPCHVAEKYYHIRVMGRFLRLEFHRSFNQMNRTIINSRAHAGMNMSYAR